MKKTLLLFLSVVIFGIAAQAQVSVGPKVGLNLTTITGKANNPFNKSLLPGLAAGIVVETKINDRFSIQPEFYYSQQGLELKVKLVNNPVRITLRTEYLNLPVLLKATFGENRLKFFAEAGPYAGYWVAGKVIGQNGSDKVVEKLDLAEEENINRFDFGLAAGGGISYAIGPGNFILDARYSFGLTPVGDEQALALIKGSNTNSALSISLGYLFPIIQGKPRSR